MKFSEAIEQCMKGKRITRKDWNGKGMYVYYTPGHLVSVDDWTGEISGIELLRGTVCVAGHFDMYNAQHVRIIGWLASQTDMSSDQWEVIE